ncbi:RluA family pseudouridine synthase [Robertkochia aurantiaca]|uniref:RluA family pseudouridine synthase n=1 Tax=Robertkochia aurantiaca TaxID=2873700 RepID=UPI001CC94265|nr:RluA family pseudouridine synthase [Robertkochia sp. 3YJGBD-33]
MNRTESHIVPEIPVALRIQEYGVGVFSAAPTKSALKKAIKKNYVRVNGEIAQTGTWIRGGETITIALPEHPAPDTRLVLPLEVLFEDEYLAAIHKPPGIAVSGNRFKTIAQALSQNMEPSSHTDATRPQPVHRLDYPTTGILLAGKTRSSIRLLNKMFAEKAVKKIYYAVTIGKMTGRGTIGSNIEEKHSRSDFEVVSSVTSERFGTLNLVRLMPQTGRRHQLRKHLFSIDHPILGDRDYWQKGLILKGKGLYLHAYSLEFEHPFTGRPIFLKDELPSKFRKIFPDTSF